MRWRLTDASRPKRMAILVSQGGALPRRPAVAPPPRRARRRHRARGLQSPGPPTDVEGFGIPYHHVPVPRTKPAELLELLRGSRHRGPGPLHADPQRGLPRAARDAGDQHPPLVPPGLRGRQPVPAGVRARREDHRRDRALRDRGARRGPDHRAGRRPRQPSRARRDDGPARPRHRAHRYSPAPSTGTSRTACSCTATGRSCSSSPLISATDNPRRRKRRRKGICMRRVVPVVAILGGLAAAGPAWADNGPPGNLGNGLARLVAPPPAKHGFRLTQAPLAIRDRQGRVLVDVYAQPQASLTAVRGEAEAAGLQTRRSTARAEGARGLRRARRRRRARQGAPASRACRRR